MIVELVRSADNKIIGWTMRGENPEEIDKLGYIRDLQFWGLDDTAIVYNGRRFGNDEANDPGELSWIQKGQKLK